MLRQYIGARYVPVIDGVWNEGKAYEPLTIVSYPDEMGSSYTSKKSVPAGINPTNSEYWALTGSYNAQVGRLQGDVDEMKPMVNALNDSFVTPQMFGAVADGVNDDSNAIIEALESGKNVFFPIGTYLCLNNIGISMTTPIRIYGAGVDQSKILLQYNEDTIFNHTGGSVWKSNSILIDGLSFEIEGGLTFNFFQFGCVENCHFKHVGDRADSVCIKCINECHYFVINNCAINKFNKGVVFDASNGCTIKNTIIVDCETPYTLNSNYNLIECCDIEGFNNGSSKIVGNKNHLIDVHHERCRRGSWIEVSGNSNVLDVLCDSDGIHAADPFLNVTGKRNSIRLAGVGYTIFNLADSSNTFEILEWSAPMTAEIMTTEKLHSNTIKFPKGRVLFDLSRGDNLSGIMTLQNATISNNKQIVTSSANASFSFNFKNLSDTPKFIIMKCTNNAGSIRVKYSDYSAAQAFNPQVDKGLIYSNENLNYYSGAAAGAAFTIDKLIVCEYGNDVLIDA